VALTKVTGFGIGTIVDNVVMTSDDPTITMTDSSGTNDIATIQATSGALIVTARDGSADGEIIFKKTDGSATDETMRLNSSGNLLLGTGSDISTGQRLAVKYSYSNPGAAWESDNVNAHNAIVFKNPNGTVGTIRTGSSATSYNTSSDYRLKENVDYTWDATTRLKQLKPARFNFIADADVTVDGFLAHEVQTVVPEAISGTKDAVDDDGNPVMQGIDQSKIVPLLVKTILELEARITALETA